MSEHRDFAHGRIELVLGNIVEQDTDVVVNAANTQLKGGGGVDGAIHRAAGKELLAHCLALPADDKGRRCQTGEVVLTPGFGLKAKRIVHAVGPFYNERSAERCRLQLAALHGRALAAATSVGATSIAFPAISTGAYRFPIDDAAQIAVREAARSLASPSTLTLIRFVLYKPRILESFANALRQIADGP